MTKVVNVDRKDIYGETFYRLYRQWEVQKKPYSSALPFNFRVDERVSVYTSSGAYSPSLGQWVIGDRSTSHISNLCYEKFNNQLGDTSTWANNLLEARESVGMIASRANQLLRFTNALRKGDVGKAANILNTEVPTKVKRQRGKADFGSTWLEFHFGWVPLVGDIGNGVETLQSTDFGGKKLEASRTESYNDYRRHEDGPGSYTKVTEKGTLSARMGAHALITNANAFLANRMGFVNPASVAWEAVPYSFVVDWFSNVGQVLGSMTDFVGVTLSSPYTTSFQRGSRHDEYVANDPDWPQYNYYKSFSSTGVRCARTAVISGPTLEVKPFKGFSVPRAATAISLLLQKL